jgi:hypothetical protein
LYLGLFLFGTESDGFVVFIGFGESIWPLSGQFGLNLITLVSTFSFLIARNHTFVSLVRTVGVDMDIELIVVTL